MIPRSVVHECRNRRGTAPPFIVGLAASCLLHALVLQARFSIAVDETPSLHRTGAESVPAQSVLRILPVAEDEVRRNAEAPEIALQPQPAPHVDASATLVARASVVAPQPSATLRTASLRERLRSTIPFAPVIENKLFDEERIDVPGERIARSLHLFNDSVAMAEEGARVARDWTRTSSHGERWGISVARLNLGRYTIPLQYDTTEDVFRAPLHRREEQQRRLLLFEETERQVTRAEIDAQVRASLLEIRARTDAKRDSIRWRGRDDISRR